MKVSSEDPIEKVTKDIEKKENIPARQQRLLFDGKQLLDNKKKLSDCNIPEESTLDLIVGKPMNVVTNPPQRDPIPFTVDTKIKLTKKKEFQQRKKIWYLKINR